METSTIQRSSNADFDDHDEFDGPPEFHSTDADSFERGAAFGGLEIRVTSRSFRAGRVTAVFSGVTIDLRDALLAPDGATISVQSALSGIDILVPNDWSVVCEVDAVCGGVGGNGIRRPASEVGPRLRVTGTVVAGGLTVR